MLHFQERKSYCNVKEGDNPFKKIIELINQNKDYYEIKEVTDE